MKKTDKPGVKKVREIVSISLGSSKRDHSVEAEFLGTRFKISRIGTDGDFEKAIRLLKELDGKVDAFGLGGIDLYLRAGKRSYIIRDAAKLREAVTWTPVVDGSGLKNTLERQAIHFLQKEGWLDFKGKTVLMVSAVDRFGMAEALNELGCRMIFGDLMFGLGIPIPIRSMAMLRFLARLLLPIVTKMPFQMLYPTGSKQEKKPKPKYEKYYREADIIAGDFLFIKKYLPETLEGKIILTNTVTEEDLKDLRLRRAKMLITTTPELGGRSFGTNVMEAMLVSLIEKPWVEITSEDYLDMLKKLDFKPRIEKLN